MKKLRLAVPRWSNVETVPHLKSMFGKLRNTLLAILCGAAALASAVQTAKKEAIAKRPQFAPYNGGILPKFAPILAGDWSVRPAFPKLVFQNPMGLCAVPGTNDLLVWEREGKVWRHWLRLAWRNQDVTASVSTDGKTWKETGRATIPFAGPVMPGLCLSGHNLSEEADAAFDAVKIEGRR